MTNKTWVEVELPFGCGIDSPASVGSVSGDLPHGARLSASGSLQCLDDGRHRSFDHAGRHEDERPGDVRVEHPVDLVAGLKPDLALQRDGHGDRSAALERVRAVQDVHRRVHRRSLEIS